MDKPNIRQIYKVNGIIEQDGNFSIDDNYISFIAEIALNNSPGFSYYSFIYTKNDYSVNKVNPFLINFIRVINSDIFIQNPNVKVELARNEKLKEVFYKIYSMQEELVDDIEDTKNVSKK